MLSFCLFVFPLWWARLSEVVVLSADAWVWVFVWFVVQMRHLHRVLLVVGRCHILYSSGFLYVSSHYLILLRVRVWESVLPLQRFRACSQVLSGSVYSFSLVRYSCLLSAVVLHALLCLKVYPDVSMERDILHVYLLFCHLVLSNFAF